MSMLQQIYQEANSGRWAEINPKHCPCRGGGWLLSDVDTWHQCPQHGHGVPHPWDEDAVFDYAAHKLRGLREAYVTFRRIARKNGFRGHFKNACNYRLTLAGNRAPTPQDWVDMAENLADEFARDEAELRAQQWGYSSALEMRQHEDAMIEQAEQEQYLRWVN